MPNSREHRDKASHNCAFLQTFEVDDYPDWVAVAAFYAAVHLVERLRTVAPSPTTKHSTDHVDRGRFARAKHRQIQREYHELYNTSLIARYETTSGFNTKIKPADVRHILVGKYLTAIESYVDFFFAPRTPAGRRPCAGR